MQHNMRDPNRDHEHGRIYRITAKGRDLLPPVKMRGKPISEVLHNFFSKENGVRYRARIELSGRDTDQVLQEVEAFTSTLDPEKAVPDRDQAQALLESLWVYEEHRAPNIELVGKTFQADEPRIRAAAIRTLGHWAKHRIHGEPQTGHLPGWQDLLASAARDESALVRAEAVKAAIEFEGLSAAEVIFEVATRPLDPELNDVLAYARGRINVDHMISEAIASQTELSDAAQAYAIATAAPDLLLKMRKSPKVYNALLSREGIPAKYRREALEAMAKAHDRTLLQQLVATLKEAEAAKQSSLNDLAAMLPSIATETGDDKSLLKQVADQTGSSVVRSAAYTALLMSDSSPQLWRHAVSSRQHLQDFLTSVRKVAGKEQAEVFFPLVRQLLFELPESLRSGGDDVKSHDGPAVSFEYYAPNPKDVSIETLNGLQPALTGQIAKFETFVPGGAKDAFATRQTTSIAVPSTGEYTFYLASDDGSRMVLDGEEIIDNDGLHGIVEKSHKVRLDAGMHALVVTYFDNGGGDGLQVSWEGPGFTKQVLDATVLRPPGSGNLKQQALEVIAAWPGHLDQKIQDFSKLIVDDSLTATAIRAMSALPSKTVSEKLSQDESIAILKRLLERAAA
ncbi:MAG: PA14 domain-containing protein, partial [Pirellulaceae bacterium]